MDRESAARGGALLWQAWQERAQLDALPADCRPGSTAEAYAVQDGLAARAGLRIAGYKIGATNAQVQARFGVDAPFSGRLFADFVGESPLTVPANSVNFHAIEAEFDFVMARRSAPATRHTRWRRCGRRSPASTPPSRCRIHATRTGSPCGRTT